MRNRGRVLAAAASAVLGATPIAAQVLPTGTGGFPNVPQTAGALLSGLHAPSQGRTAILAYHGGVLFTVPELPSSQPNSDFQVRTWDISNPAAPVMLSSLGTSPMPINAHGYFTSGEYLVLGGNFPPATPWSFRWMQDGTLQRTTFPGLLGISDRGHTFAPWYVGPTYRLYFPSQAPAEIRLNGVQLGTWDHLGQTGVIGHPFLLGNLLIFAAEESRTGVATYDVSDPANPVLLDVLRDGGAGGYWPELWAGGGRLYAVFPYRLDGNGFRVVDLTDPTDLRFVADRVLPGATAQYAQFQDEYAFIGDHKIDMRTFDSVLFLDGANRARTSGGTGIDTSQFALPIGNLLVTGGIGPNQGMAIWAHQAAPDTRGPSVTYHIPRAGQTGYPVRAPISLMIHETLDTRTIVPGTTLIVRPIGGNAISGTAVFAFDDILTFTPQQPLQADTTYEVVIPANGIRDAAGNGIVAHQFTFSTGNLLSGNAPPAVQSIGATPQPLRPGQTLSLSAAATDPEGGALEYRFDYGDGGATEAWSANSQRTHAYAETGHYTVTVQVRDAAGSIASGARRITVVPALTGPAASHSHNALCDAARRRVWVLDRDNGGLVEFDADSLQRLRAISVCAGPRSLARAAGGTLWIACENDDSVRALDEVTLQERWRVDAGYGAAPVAVVASADGGTVYAAYSGTREVVRFDAANGAELARMTLEAAPRALALSGDGSRLFATRWLSDTHDAHVWRLRTSPLQLDARATIPRFGGVSNADTPASGRGVANQLSSIALAPLDGRAWVTANKANDARGTLASVEADLGADSTVRNLLIGVDATSLALRRAIDLDNSDSASAVAFSPDGDYALIALQGNDEIAVLDALAFDAESGSGSVVGRFSTGAAPQGLCVDAPTRRTFVANFVGRSLSVLDTAALFERGSLNVPRNDLALGMTERLAPEALRGKRVFYFASDPRMSAEGYMSCATCHVDGGSDGRTWDFGGRGEGLRNTIDLRGRAGLAHGNVHWSANFDEIQDFENDIRGAFGGSGFLSDADYAATQSPLGAPKTGRSADLDALARFVSSLGAAMLPRSPWRDDSGDAEAAAVRGRGHFVALGCGVCHRDGTFSDSRGPAAVLLHDAGTLRTSSGRRLGGTLTGIDTPTLLGVWATAPYLHDGSARTLGEVFDAAGGVAVPAEQGSVSAGAQLAPGSTEVNNDDTVRGRGYVQFGAVGSTVQLANVDGGPGGIGRIELRASAASSVRVDVVVNGTPYGVNIAASGNVPAFRRTRWPAIRVDGVALNPGATNTVAVRTTMGAPTSLGLDEIVVTTSDVLARGNAHRTALTLDAAARADLEAYLLSLDANDAPATDPLQLLRSGFEDGE
jgi:outer membrane protein assembly factor BamB